jgi:putative MATE family efflux protein
MLQLLIQNLVSLIDNFMVAGLGDIKMAGINVANQLNMVYFVLVNALCMAGGIFISQYNGAQNAEGMKHAYRFKMIVCLVISLIYLFLCQAIPDRLMGIMLKGNSASVEIIAQSVIYLRLVSITWIPIAISTVIGSSLRETGLVTPPLYIAIAATLINTLLNWLLIYGNLGAPRLEVAGAAAATCIARLAEMALYFVYVYRKKPAFFAKWRTLFRIELTLFGVIMRKSALVIVSDLSWIITETIMTAVYNGRGGADIVAGMAAGWAVANIFLLVQSGIYTATGVIIGGTLGQGKLKEAKIQAGWVKSGAASIGFGVMIIQCFSIYIVPFVFGNLTADARLIARNMILVTAAYLPVWAYLTSQFSISRAGGDTIMGAMVDVLVSLFVFLPGLFILARFTPLGPVAMFAMLKLTDFLKIGIASWQLKKDRWVRNLTETG